jgi:hypothetical protein
LPFFLQVISMLRWMQGSYLATQPGADLVERVSDRRQIQVIRRPAPEILARSRYRAERSSGACDPGDAGLGNAPE